MEARHSEFQRDFYRLLLDMGRSRTSPASQVDHALRLLVAVARADKGYLTLRDPDGTTLYEASSFDREELTSIRDHISTGIIAEAIARSEPIVVPSALLDEEFGALESVRRNAIEAIVCVPFKNLRGDGVLYLQGDSLAEHAAETLQDGQRLIETLSPLLSRLLNEGAPRRGNGLSERLRSDYALDDVIGSSEPFSEALRTAMMVAALDVPVLVLGETGSGKTQLVRAIHDNSPRRDGPFLSLNCATLGNELFESEMFGALRGSHSTATKDIQGKVDAAAGGTLFLDEIGELSLAAQAKILQFLQTRRYFPLGATREREADVRLAFATNRDLDHAQAAGTFRQDLYFRISTFELTVPPLRDRRADIPALARHFAESSIARHRLNALTLADDALEALCRYDWPGNLRELEGTIERACVQASFAGAPCVSADVLPALANEAASYPAPSAAPTDTPTNLEDATRRSRELAVRRALKASGGNVSKAARMLDMSRSHLYTLMDNFGIQRD